MLYELGFACNSIVEKAFKRGKTFEEIRNLLVKNPTEEKILEKLEMYIDDGFLPVGTTLEDYRNKIDEIENEYKISYEMTSQSSIIIDEETENDTELSNFDHSNWNSYKKQLQKKGFSNVSIMNIQHDASKIRKRLTTVYNDEIGPIKGLVVGSVQSGKTANMGALIAQCADSGWNMFVVISGMIESLRSQTEERLLNDLDNEDTQSRWHRLDKIYEKGKDNYQELCNLKLDTDKYLCVVLKNKSRLENINKWLKRANNKTKLKMLIIDDECDQGSINTKSIESKEMTAIYRQIRKMVNEGLKEEKGCGAMNYISYTATPYANILNDSKKESLYPSSFIATLTQNKLYFGPQIIFGLSDDKYNGLSITNNISDEENMMITKSLKEDFYYMPESLINALAWFSCSVSAMRFRGHKKPVSMLINVSPSAKDHNSVEKTIIEWFREYDLDDFIDYCKIIYKNQTETFSKDIFKIQFEDYENMDKVEDYPSFDDIKPYLEELLKGGTKKIVIDENEERQYTRNIHLCVDNCYNNKVTENNELLRLLYPKNIDDNNPAPAFIVIGGNTLSRGLTIEGLVCTYFLRKGRQADTLMQMGRWFGYRPKYELYPRIWMDSDAISKFLFLSQLDHDLRKDLNKYMQLDYSPKKVGPLITSTPSVSWLRIAAKNKMQSAIEADFNYTGFSGQTIYFDKDENILTKNVELTKQFIDELGEMKDSRTGRSKVWLDVDIDIIINYLKKFEFCKKNKVFNDLTFFVDWLKKANDNNLANTEKWNVVLSGIHNDTNGVWPSEEKPYIYKVNRSARPISKDLDYYNIGVLRSFEDNFEDTIGVENFDEQYKIIDRNQDPYKIKESLGIDLKPLLVLYVISKDSKRSVNSNRIDLNAKQDLIGMYLTIPGDKYNSNYSYKITVKLDKVEEEEEEE